MKKLDPDVDYPFRSSLTKVARCGMCIHFSSYVEETEHDPLFYEKCELGKEKCELGKEIRYPYMANEHDCQDYMYKPFKVPRIKEGYIKIFIGEIKKLKECDDCSHNLENYCEGVSHFPFKTTPRCEFFRNKELICKHAIPYFQYGTTIRNNYCSLEPSKREGDMKRGWKWSCPWAHEKTAEYYKCYEPMKRESIKILKSN